MQNPFHPPTRKGERSDYLVVYVIQQQSLQPKKFIRTETASGHICGYQDWRIAGSEFCKRKTGLRKLITF